MKRTAIKPISKKQKAKQDNWNRLVAFLSSFGMHNGFYQTECCNSISTQPLVGHHIISKGRGGKWTADNCLLVSMWCGCHNHDLKDGLRIPIKEALEIARKRNEKYNINPDYDGSKEKNPYFKSYSVLVDEG